MNKYYLQARLLPTTLTSIPLFFLINEIIIKLYGPQLKGIFSILPHLTSLGISAAFVFLFIQINRMISKVIFQKLYFKDELYMPTTTRLLLSDGEVEPSIKQNLRARIFDKYNIQLMPIIEEQSNELNARKKIAYAVSQMRNSLRDNTLLLQHNIEFGFMRNLLGGCIPAVMVSIAIVVFGYLEKSHSLKIEGLLLLVIYLIPVLLSKSIINAYGKMYQKVLFEQFLSLK